MNTSRSTPPGKGGFCTLFGSRAHRFDTGHLNLLASVMARARLHGWSDVDSGYVYLGQFIAHDVSKLVPPKQPFVRAAELEQLRTPELDLDPVYGYEGDRQVAIDAETGKLQLGLTVDAARAPGSYDDLPRDLQGAPLIGDERNEDNLILAQLHVQFLKLHNFFVDRLADDDPLASPQALFEGARRQLILHYQEVVLYDFLQRIADQQVWSHVVLNQTGTLWHPTPGQRVSTPVEFAAAAFRFGHAMVRDSYALNLTRSASIDEVLFMHPQGPTRHARLRNSDRIRWEYFFGNADSVHLNVGFAIRPSADVFLSDDGRSLALRNLLAGNNSSLPCAQAIIAEIKKDRGALAHAVGLQPLSKQQLSPPAHFDGSETAEPLLSKLDVANDFENATPLWYYLLAEAYAQHQGSKLGTLGSLIVASVLRGAVAASRPSIFEEHERHPPYITATRRVPGSPARFLCMDDLLRAVRE